MQLFLLLMISLARNSIRPEIVVKDSSLQKENGAKVHLFAFQQVFVFCFFLAHI